MPDEPQPNDAYHQQRADDAEVRAQALEEELRNLRQRKDAIDYEAHDVRHSATGQERAEFAARDKAFDDYAKSPASTEISTLFARIVAIESKFSRMVGHGGIRVTNGEVFDFSMTVARVADVAASTGNTLRFRVCVGGTARDVDITDAVLVPL